MKWKQRYLWVVIFLLIMCVLLIWRKCKDTSIEKELLYMSKTITVDELENSGYIDTANIKDSKDDKIERFLYKAYHNQKAKLKTFQVLENKLYVKIYLSDPELREIRLWTCLPWEQKAIAPDKRFDSNYERDEENNIVTIILRNKKNRSIPVDNQVLIDEALYTYYNKEK